MATTKQKTAADPMTAALAGYDDLVALGQENFTAVMKANATALAGAQRLNGQVANYMKATYEANMAVARDMVDAKSVEDAVKLQSGHIKATVDTAMAKGAEFSEAALAVANDVAEPLQARAKVTFDRLMKPLAA